MICTQISIGVATCFLAATAIAGQTYEVKGLKPGDSTETFLKAFPGNYCHVSKSTQGDESCGAIDQSFAGAKASYLAFAIESRITSINVQFSSDDFEVILAALTDKFGPPAKRTKETVVTRAGAKYLNETATWQSENRFFILNRYASSVDSGLLILSDAEAFTRIKRYTAEKRTSAIKDM